MVNSLITLNNRLAIAAAAIVHKMMILSRPLVFFPVTALKTGSLEVSAMTTKEKKRKEREGEDVLF